MKRKDDSGITLVVTLLVLMLLAALMAGFFAAVNADMRANALDKDQTRAYAAAHAGLEKLTSDLAGLFNADVSPSTSQITALADNPPVIDGFEFVAPGGAAKSGYVVTWKGAPGNPAPEDPLGSNITAGNYKGFKGIVTKYPITITARSTSGGAEVRLRREVQTVAVPVFQFGVFSESDLTFYAGDPFNFGGRVHTNGNLFVCTFVDSLQFSDRITAVGEVVRTRFSNTLAVGSYGCTGEVLLPVTIGSPGTYRNLNYSPNEGSVTGMPDNPPGSTQSSPNTNWTTLSTSTYKNNVKTTLTGAKKLTLPIVNSGALPRDLILRAPVNDDVTNPAIYPQRYYAQSSLRILLSDRTTDITALPGIVTAVAPLALDNWATLPTGIVARDATHPRIARSPGPIALTALTGDPTSSGSPVVWSIPVAIPAAPLPSPLAMPPLQVGGTAGVVCTGKTTTAFTGCNMTGSPGSGTIITATVTIGGSTSVGAYSYTATATMNASSSGSSGSRTLPVPTNATLPFSRSFFWANGTATGTTPPPVALVSCTGYTPTALTGCLYSTADSTIPPGTSTYDPWTISTNALSTVDQALIGGYIKIEKQSSLGVWSDVTAEILNLGIADKNQEGVICQDPNPDAVIRIQRLRDNGGSCDYSTTAANAQNPYDYWPNALYDTREGNTRDVAISGAGSAMKMGGVMNYITLDAGNLKKWFAGTTGTTGTVAWNNGGYIVYFSDRRGNHLAASPYTETGEYGFEDIVNPLSATGTPNGTIVTTPEAGEDANGNGTLELYGGLPATTCVACAVTPAGAPTTAVPFGLLATPMSAFTGTNSPGQARVNRQVLFRRALKLQNGGIVSGVNMLPTAGFTVVSENPVYVQGNWNATSASANTDPHVATAVIADAVTVLSNNWSDAKSMKYPNDPTGNPMGRDATTTSYRFAVVAGKSLSFPWPTGLSPAPHFLFGTDGGAGNFLHLLENWNITGVSINYRGSIISLYSSRQATGTFKYGSNVYDYGTRNFVFDTDFLLPSLLPPGTPMFRDINTLTFRQILRPTQ